MIRYRTGIDRNTGRPLVGWPHAEQSIARLLETVIGSRVMLLGYGNDTVRQIGRNMVPPVVLEIYRNAVTAIHRWEPEFRVGRCELVGLERTGAISFRTGGLYYPEGRFGNYRISEERTASVPFTAAETMGAAA